jgi:hypothetical protein
MQETEYRSEYHQASKKREFKTITPIKSTEELAQ